MNFIKKAILGLTAMGTVTATKAADLEKTNKKLSQETNTSIDYQAPKQKSDEKNYVIYAENQIDSEQKLRQESEEAAQNLIKTQLEAKALIKKLEDRFAFDPVTISYINKFSDIVEKTSVFATGFLKDRIDHLDSTQVQKYIQDAIAFAQDEHSLLGTEFKAMKTLSENALLGSVINKEGIDLITGNVEANVLPSETQDMSAYLGGEHNILFRLIADNITFRTKKAVFDNMNQQNQKKQDSNQKQNNQDTSVKK